MHDGDELLSLLNNDLTTLLNSVKLVMITVGADVSVGSFIARATSMPGLVAGDAGGPAIRLKLKVDLAKLEQMMLRVIQDAQFTQEQGQDSEGKCCTLRITPYRTLDNRVDGVVLTVLENRQMK
jgi:two-component system CheB/CheR fusion protein